MIQSSDIRYTRNLFLRCVSVIYLFAFASLYIQIPGLYGNHGILPVRTQLDSKEIDYRIQIQKKPTLLWFAPFFGLSTEYMMDILAIGGMFLAFSGFISQRFCAKPTFAALWSLYYSLYQVGQLFMWFQWDILLLETGFLCILLAPLWQSKSQQRKTKGGQGAASAGGSADSIKMWLVKWLLFRLLFSSGVLKFTSGCPSWWGLSALKVHFESMALPTPLAWYSHHLPSWILKSTTAFSLVADIALPVLFFAPIKPLRTLAFLLQAILQIFIIITGNFNFFNYLTLALCLSVVDDSFFCKGTQKKQGWMSKILSYLLTLVIFGGIVYGTVVLFGFKLLPGGTLDAKINFNNKQFDKVLGNALPVISIVGAISLALTSFKALSAAMSQSSASSVKKLLSTVSTMIYICIAGFIFADSLVPLSTLHPSGNATIPAAIKKMHSDISHLHLTNSYGLFRRMTGVGGRPEVVIEGANKKEGPWIEYNFKYKPGNVNKSLPIVAPHQPRLDWQMWFAALGTYHQNPWLLSLTYRLLMGQKEVLDLMDRGTNPFPNSPPKFIRANLYHYHYTPWTQRNSEGVWSRHKVGEYFPVFSKDHPPLVEYLQKMNLLNEPKQEKISPPVKKGLDTMRGLFSDMDPGVVMLALFMAGLTAIVVGSLIPGPAHKPSPPPAPVKHDKKKKK